MPSSTRTPQPLPAVPMRFLSDGHSLRGEDALRMYTSSASLDIGHSRPSSRQGTTHDVDPRKRRPTWIAARFQSLMSSKRSAQYGHVDLSQRPESPLPPLAPTNTPFSAAAPTRPSLRSSTSSGTAEKLSSAALLTHRLASVVEEKPVLDYMTVSLLPNMCDGSTVYRPGDTVTGSIFIHRRAGKIDTLKCIDVCVKGQMVVSRYESTGYDPKAGKPTVRRRKWHFYDSVHASLTLDSLSEVYEIGPVASTSADAQKYEAQTEGTSEATSCQQMTIPFAFVLPTKCTSYKRLPASQNERSTVPLPPTAQVDVLSKGTTSNSSNSAHSSPPQSISPATGFRGKLERMQQNRRGEQGGPTFTASVQYFVVTTVEWGNGKRRLVQHRRMVECIVPFTVQPRPPKSIPVSRHLTARAPILRDAEESELQDRLAVPPRAGGLPITASPTSSNNLTLVEHAPHTSMRALLLPTLAIADEAGSAPPSMANAPAIRPVQLPTSRVVDSPLSDDEVSTPAGWQDIVLCETQRGQQAWNVYHLPTRVVDMQLSFPATGAVQMDQPVPFLLTMDRATTFKMRSDTLRFSLLRSVNNVSPSGKLVFEDRVPQHGGEAGGNSNLPPIVELSNIEVQADGLHGSLTISSGWQECCTALFNASASTLPLVLHNKQERKAAQRAAARQQVPRNGVRTPSFTFQGLNVQYALRISIDLVDVRQDAPDDVQHVAIETPTIQLAAPTTFSPAASESSATVFAPLAKVDSRERPAPPRSRVVRSLSATVPSRRSSLVAGSRPRLAVARHHTRYSSPPESVPSHADAPVVPVLRATALQGLTHLDSDGVVSADALFAVARHRSASMGTNNQLGLQTVPPPPPYRNSNTPPPVPSKSPFRLNLPPPDSIYPSLRGGSLDLSLSAQPVLVAPTAERRRDLADISTADSTDIEMLFDVLGEREQAWTDEGVQRQALNNIASLQSLRTLDGPSPSYLDALRDAM